MNAQMLKRLFKAMGEGKTALDSVAEDIVQSERRQGHVRLAAELETLRERRKRESPVPTETVRELRPLSKSQELLVTLVPPDQLAHSMVLAPEVEARFARIESEFAAKDRLAQCGLEPRRRILLYGPPGCGKTLGAQRLAWTLGLPLMKVRFDSLVSSLFGETASNLRKVFDHARRQPSVLLLDECDYIARSRTGRHDIGETSRVVNTLLQLLEEFNGPGLLVATTNIDRELDDALFRRFDDAFAIPLPEKREIRALLDLALSSMTVSGTSILDSLAGKLEGESAAGVVKVARDAAKLAVLDGSPKISQQNLAVALKEHRKGGR